MENPNGSSPSTTITETESPAYHWLDPRSLIWGSSALSPEQPEQKAQVEAQQVSSDVPVQQGADNDFVLITTQATQPLPQPAPDVVVSLPQQATESSSWFPSLFSSTPAAPPTPVLPPEQPLEAETVTSTAASWNLFGYFSTAEPPTPAAPASTDATATSTEQPVPPEYLDVSFVFRPETPPVNPHPAQDLANQTAAEEADQKETIEAHLSIPTPTPSVILAVPPIMPAPEDTDTESVTVPEPDDTADHTGTGTTEKHHDTAVVFDAQAEAAKQLQATKQQEVAQRLEAMLREVQKAQEEAAQQLEVTRKIDEVRREMKARIDAITTKAQAEATQQLEAKQVEEIITNAQKQAAAIIRELPVKVAGIPHLKPANQPLVEKIVTEVNEEIETKIRVAVAQATALKVKEQEEHRQRKEAEARAAFASSCSTGEPTLEEHHEKLRSLIIAGGF